MSLLPRRRNYSGNPGEAGDPTAGNGERRVALLAVYKRRITEGIRARVVSMPSWELFERQSQAYPGEVIPPHVTARISVEQASMTGWDRPVDPVGASIGMNTFGASAPLKALQKKFEFTADRLVVAVKERLARDRSQRSSIRV